jgi:hypothetical protein
MPSVLGATRQVHFKLHDFRPGSVLLEHTMNGGGYAASPQLRFAGSGFATGIGPHRMHGKLRLDSSATALDQAFAYYELSGHPATRITKILFRRCCALNGTTPRCITPWTSDAAFPRVPTGAQASDAARGAHRSICKDRLAPTSAGHLPPETTFAQPTERSTSSLDAERSTSSLDAPVRAQKRRLGLTEASTPRPLRLAHCITGLATSTHHTLIEALRATKLRRWLDGVGIHFAANDVFLHLDLAVATTRQKYNESPIECERQSTRNFTVAQLRPMLEALSPVSFEAASHDCPCAIGVSACGCSFTWARWWLQVAKWRACLDQVGRHERRIERRYDFVAKLRSDVAPVSTPREAAHVYMAAAHRIMDARLATPASERIIVQGWRNGRCYGKLDHSWLASRDGAELIGSVGSATCGWQRCLWRRYARDTSALKCMANERLLVEWLLDARESVSISPWPSIRLLQAEDQTAVEVRDEVVITAAHEWHRAAHAPQLARCEVDDGERLHCNAAHSIVRDGRVTCAPGLKPTPRALKAPGEARLSPQPPVIREGGGGGGQS